MNKIANEIIAGSEYTADMGDMEQSNWQTFINGELLIQMVIQECCRVMKKKDAFYGERMGNVIKDHFGIEDE